MTFISPLDTLGDTWKVEYVDWEIYTGSFACQRDDCWAAATEAKYAPNELILTWKCPNGHISKIEDYAG